MKSGKFGAAQAPFSTTDAILAYCLYVSGVPFFDPQQPCINLYDAEILNKLGYHDVKMEEAISAAMAHKQKGHVEYAFQRVPQLRRFLKAYSQQAEALQKVKESPERVKLADMVTELTLLELDPAEMVLRLACLLLKTRVQFMNIWQDMQPLVRVKNKGNSRKLSPMTTRYPGFRIMSLNASEETRKKLKL